jgi:diaminopimelate decarboxylase
MDATLARNPLAAPPRSNVISAIDGVQVESLLKDFGSPLFVMSEQTLRARADAQRRAFRDRYDKVEFAWSFKTNPLDAVCQVFQSEGWLAEVVSSFEYEKARHLGYSGRQIIFNGPYKREESIRRSLREGALIQIDNWDELLAIEKIAGELGGKFDVGLRVMISTGLAPTWSKFGFSAASGEAHQAALRLIANPNLRLHTLHSHIGTYILDPGAYRVATQVLLGLREVLRKETGHRVACLNLGGGFPSDSLLHGMAGPTAKMIPSIDRYAEAITTPLNQLAPADRPLLRLETGRHLVDNAGYLLTTVVAIKGGGNTHWAPANGVAAKAGWSGLADLPQRRGYVVDSGVNLLYTAAWFAIEVSPAQPGAAPVESVRLLGDLCMEIDVIREHVLLPRLQTGDRLVLHPVGAYNINQSMTFIHLRPAIVMINTEGQPRGIRRREVLEDAEALEEPSDIARMA